MSKFEVQVLTKQELECEEMGISFPADLGIYADVKACAFETKFVGLGTPKTARKPRRVCGNVLDRKACLSL